MESRARQERYYLFHWRFQLHQGELCLAYLTGGSNVSDGEAGGFTDAWHVAEERKNPVSTGHGYRGPREENRRIDWILMRPALRVMKAETVIYQRNGLYASDHFAVYAEVEMPDERAEE